MAAAAALTCLCIQLSCGAFRRANLRCNFAQSLIICPAYFLPLHCPLQGEFIDHVRTAGSPTQQLKLLNNYRPAELALTGASDEQWDAAVYTTLDRATLLKRLLRGGHASSGSFGARICLCGLRAGNYLCVYVYIHIHVYMCVCSHLHTRICTHTHTHVA
jgi:hypothetical protein